MHVYDSKWELHMQSEKMAKEPFQVDRIEKSFKCIRLLRRGPDYPIDLIDEMS